eukprot:7385506-Prymnesium_polylepis.1
MYQARENRDDCTVLLDAARVAATLGRVSRRGTCTVGPACGCRAQRVQRQWRRVGPDVDDRAEEGLEQDHPHHVLDRKPLEAAQHDVVPERQHKDKEHRRQRHRCDDCGGGPRLPLQLAHRPDDRGVSPPLREEPKVAHQQQHEQEPHHPRRPLHPLASILPWAEASPRARPTARADRRRERRRERAHLHMGWLG